MDSDRIWGGVVVGGILLGWIVWMISRVVASIFHDLGIMFNAIGTAAVSFLGMAWALTQLAAVLAAGAAVVYAAYRHYQLVKQATEVMTAVEARCADLANTVETSQKELEKQVRQEVWALRRELEVALAEPEVGPEEPKALPPPAGVVADEIVIETALESATAPRVSNPY